MNKEPFVIAAHEILNDSFVEVLRCIEGLSLAGLNWRPSGGQTNSLAVLAMHSLRSTLNWLEIAFGQPLTDRDLEFLVSADDSAPFQERAQSLVGSIQAVLASDIAFDGASLRPTGALPDSGDAPEVAAAWALLHTVDHLREHVGQMLLTHQLWSLQTST